MRRHAEKFDEHAVICKCFLCRSDFQFGPHAYRGRPIPAWGGIMVCDGCESANWDGIVPTTYPHLKAHLQQIGVTPVMNENGWLPIPQR
jgi:hypothetical protein